MPSSIRSTRALLAAFAALSGFLSFSNAQSVATTPVGAMTYSFPATGASSATAYFTVPLSESSSFAGAVSSVAANTLTFSGTPFTAGGLSQVGAPYFLRITSGAQIGRTILVTANTASTVTVDTTDNSSQTTALNLSGFAVAAGDKVEIIPGDTIASFFGNDTVGAPLLINKGANFATADNILIWNKNTGKNDIYFFSSVSNVWRTSASAVSRNNQVLYPENAFGITRLASSPALSFTVLGQVPAVSIATKVTGSSSTIQTGTSYPVNLTLAQFASIQPNWTKGANFASADTINIYNPTTGKFQIYFQRADNSLWNLSGGGTTDRSSVVIPAGSSVRVVKLNAITDMSQSYLKIPLPYTL